MLKDCLKGGMASGWYGCGRVRDGGEWIAYGISVNESSIDFINLLLITFFSLSLVLKLRGSINNG